jgi:MFS family permease
MTGTTTGSYEQGMITSMLLLGAFASNVFVGSLADAVGRRAAILAGCVVFLVGGAFQTAAQGLSWMYGGRFIAGIGIGMLAMLAPLYQSEVPRIRHPRKRHVLTPPARRSRTRPSAAASRRSSSSCSASAR